MEKLNIMWEANVLSCIAITSNNKKNLKSIVNELGKAGFIFYKRCKGKECEDAAKKTINSIKKLGWIEETKDAYVLTEKGKIEVDKYTNVSPTAMF